MRSEYSKIEVIDSHTAGEPTRLVIEGFPQLGGESMAIRLAKLRDNHDEWRRTTILNHEAMTFSWGHYYVSHKIQKPQLV